MRQDQMAAAVSAHTMTMKGMKPDSGTPRDSKSVRSSGRKFKIGRSCIGILSAS
jgi:hypothetical protein